MHTFLPSWKETPLVSRVAIITSDRRWRLPTFFRVNDASIRLDSGSTEFHSLDTFPVSLGDGSPTSLITLHVEKSVTAHLEILKP